MVLLVDDQAIVAEAVRRCLANLGDVDFHYCADPKQAVALATQLRPTVILQDLVMPGIDGLELLKQYRANPGTANVPVIVLSTKEDPKVKGQAFELGANDYLVKLPDRVETDRQRQEAVDRATPSRPLPKDPIPGRLSASDFESKSARLVRQPSPAAQDRPADDGLFESVPGIGEEKIVTEHRVATTQPQPERTAPDDVEDYLRDIDKPREISPKVRIPLTIVEKSCLGGAAVLVLSAVIWFSSTLFGSRPRGGEEPPSIRPSLPMKGSLFTIEAATTGWRDATAGDKLSMMAITFPVRGERQPAIVPTVQVTMASLPQSGYMRIIFRDPAGKQAGDTRILKVNGGALEPTHSGEEILSGTQAIVHCSKGYLSEQDLITYQAAADQDRWAVEIAESADYGAADKDWKRLGFFQINNKY